MTGKNQASRNGTKNVSSPPQRAVTVARAKRKAHFGRIMESMTWRISIASFIVSALFVGAARIHFAAIDQIAPGTDAPSFGVFPWFHVVLTGLALGAAVFAVLKWAVHSLSRNGPTPGSTELFFAGVVPMAAALYFVYQFAAGALFATTSVSLDIEREDEQPDTAIVTMKLERGDNWIVEIVSAAVTTEYPHTQATSWTNSNLPRRPDGTLRLAPKETTSTKFRIKLPSRRMDAVVDQTNDIVVTARVVSYALWWPVPSESFASTLIVRPAASAASSGASRRK